MDPSPIGLLFLMAVSLLLAWAVFPAPADAQVAPAPYVSLPYRILPGDLLQIRFLRAPELDEEVSVRPDGGIGLHLVPELRAAGRTPGELRELLQELYASELRDPELSVVVKTVSARAFVDGEVGDPAEVSLARPISVLQAIALAGGATERAHTEEVLLIRRSGLESRVTLIDLERARAGEPGLDPPLMPDDIVFVPASRIARVNQWVDQYVRRNIPVSVGLRPGF
jgi:protein involved in polysaccharide export with SLBB domain